MKIRHSFSLLRLVVFVILALIFFNEGIGYTYSDPDVLLPEIGRDDDYYVQELNLETGVVTKRSIGLDDESLQKIIDIGNGKMALICRFEFPENHFADREGYVYYYNKNLRQLINLNFYATDADDITIKSNSNGTFMVIDYYRRPDNKSQIYQLQPFKLVSEQKSNRWGELVSVDDKYVYYVDFDEVIVIRSLSGHKEIKRVKLTGDYREIKNGKALISFSNMNYQIIDLWSGESKDFNFEDRGYVNLSEDSKWLMYRDADRHDFSGKVIVINLNDGQKKEVRIDPEILEESKDTITMRFGQAFFIGKKRMSILNLQSGRITCKEFVFRDDKIEKRTPLAIKAEIDELINQYEIFLIKAINTNKFSLVSKTLTPGSPLYQSQKQLVANLSGKQIQEKFIRYDINEIRMTTSGTYQVYVYEKIGIKYPNQKEFTAKEFHWVYTVKVKGSNYTLSNLEKWETEKQ